MGHTFTRAIVRPPAENLADGLTRADLGVPDYAKALQQWHAYCDALRHCGLELIELPPDPEFPDSTFVEDTAVLAGKCAVLTRPGATSREGEVARIETALAQFFPVFERIVAPGTVDGGDICESGDHFFVGISERTNEAGGRQLAHILSRFGKRSTLVDIRTMDSILHLKSGLASIGDDRLVVIDPLAAFMGFQGNDLVRVDAAEGYAANCVRVNDFVLLPAGFSKLEAELKHLSYTTITLEMSEFQKMDGGLSCLSLRF